MTILKIIQLNENRVLSVLAPGEHIVGRGELFQCRDKRVSRKHVVINVTENDGATIKSVHANPCFYMPANSKTVSILPTESSVALNDNDRFALLPDLYWFKVKVQSDDLNLLCPDETPVVQKVQTPVCNSENKEVFAGSSKRPNDEFEEHPEPKRVKLDDVIIECQTQQVACNNESQETKDESNNSSECLKLNDPTVTSNTCIDQPNQPIVTATDEIETNNDNSNKSPTPSNADREAPARLRREQCWYGDKCFRKSAKHKDTFSHPGDGDFDDDPNDNRPSCSFGKVCYRKNIEHRRRYKHSGRPAAKPKGMKQKRKSTTKRKSHAESPDEDDDIFENLYLDDSGDSDDYQISSGDCLSDSSTAWEDSQVAEEKKEDTKRLVKEAKRFIRKK